MNVEDQQPEGGGALSVADLRVVRPSTTLALTWVRPTDRALRRDTRTLATLGAALDLRRARVLDWVSRQDLAPLGYPSFTAFRAQHVEWGGSWERALRRLVKSPLQLVKAAAVRGEISLRTAASAPGKVAVEAQAAWLRDHGRGDAAGEGEPRGFDKDLFSGQEARDIHAARQRARVLIGKQARNAAVDEYIVMAWLDRRPAAELLADARMPPPPPDLTPGTWPPGPDPATEVVGPWVEPHDLDHAVALLEHLQAVGRGRRAALGLALDHLAQGGHYLEWGYDSLNRYAQGELDLSPSTTRRYRTLGASLDLHPELLAAVRGDALGVRVDAPITGPAGLDLDGAMAIDALAQTGRAVRGWLAVARHLGSAELQRLASLGKATSKRTSGSDPVVLLREAEDRVARAPHVLDKLEAGHGIGARGPLVPGQASTAGAPWRVTGPPTPPPPPHPGDALTWGHPMLLEAARWFLDTVHLPSQQSCGKAKEHQRWMCQNPECRRVTLRNQVHHIWHREHGGTDDSDNLVTVCKSCHLRLIHGGHVQVFRVAADGGDQALVWRFAARGTRGRIVVVLP